MFTARIFVLDLSFAAMADETVRASIVVSSSKTTTKIKG
jgi:hypothetical protein